MNHLKTTLFLLLIISATLSGCKDKKGGGGLNFFSLEDDKTFGAQVAEEIESDLRSVEYLYPTAYDARGAAKFFEKIIASGGGSGPQFLSTHPNPDNRVESINAHWEALGVKVGNTFDARYELFQKSLP